MLAESDAHLRIGEVLHTSARSAEHRDRRWEAYGPLCGELDVTVVEARELTNRPRKAGIFAANACTRQTFAEVVLLGCPVPPLKTEVR